MSEKWMKVALLAAAAMLSANCGGVLSGDSGSNKSAKSISPETMCNVLAQPAYESNSPFNGTACSGSTTFGARDMRTASYETDARASFSYAVFANGEKIERISLNMSKRPDGGEFFAAVGDSVAKAINGQPLPEKIRQAISAPLSTGGLVVGNVTIADKVGAAGVELERSPTDNRYSMTFKF